MLQKLINHIQQNFIEKEDWYINHIENSEPTHTNIKKILENSLVFVTNSFSESILVGEYAKDEIHFDNKISELSELLSLFLSKTSNTENSDLSDLINSYTIIIDAIKSYYSGLWISIKNHSSNTEIIFAHTGSDTTGKLETSLNKLDVKKHVFNIHHVIIVTMLDHFLTDDLDYFRRLIEIENSLDATSNFYISAVKDKISFLKYKWCFRQVVVAKESKIRNISQKYIVGNKTMSVKDVTNFISDNSTLKEWQKYIENHYTDEIDFEFYKEKKELIDIIPTYHNIHLLIRFYKDIEVNYTELTSIIEKIKSKKNNCSQEIYNKNFNYALNNQFSFLIEQSNYNENDSEIEVLKKQIEHLQRSSGYNNFFSDYKYFEYKIKKLYKALEKRAILKTEGKTIKELLDEVFNLMSICERKIDWFEIHPNLLYQLPYEECLVKYDSRNIKEVYYASSFLLPTSINKMSEEFKNKKLEFLYKQSHNYTLYSLENEFNELNGLKNEMSSKDSKSIETLTIFTAIISFIVGTASGFTFIDSFIKFCSFILIYSICIFSFVLLIFISTRGKFLLEKRGFIISIYLVVAVLLLCIFSLFRNEFGSKYNNLASKEYVDSLYRTKINDVKDTITPIKTPKKQSSSLSH